MNSNYSAFVMGFGSAVSLTAAIALFAQTQAAVSTTLRPELVAQFYHAPRFSIGDVMSAVIGLGLFALLLTVPVWGPRP